MNPQVGQSSVQNPFMQMLERMQSQGGPQSPNQTPPGMEASAKQATNPAGATPAPQGGGQASGLPGVQQPQIPPDATQLGQNPGITKNLLGAAQQLHQAIAQLTDPEEIRVVRTILLLLTNLIQRDQNKQNSTTGQGQPPQGPQAEPPTPPPSSIPPTALPGGTPVGQNPPGSIPGQRF